MGTLSGCIRKAGKALNKPDADAIRQMRNELLEDGLSAQDAAAEALALYIEELKSDYQAVYDQVGIEAPPFDPKALANYRGTVPSSSDTLRSKVDDLVQKFEGQEGVSENISAYNVTGLDETADTLAYGPKEKEAFIRFLQERGDANQVLDRLSELSNTPWAKQAVQGALARMAMKDLIAGKEVDYQNPVSYKGGALEQNLKLAGEDGMWAYLMGYNIRKLPSGKLSSKKAPRQGMIGHPEKPVNAVNGSFIDCNPSKACATYCYATKGRYNYASSTIRSELVTLAAELDADRFAEMVSNEYKAMPEFHVNKALRFFDKGDMAEQHLAVLEGLRKEGVRAQIFTKQPELLRQVNDFHLKMLSIDETNFDMAEQNPDLNVALVYDGSKKMTDWALDNLDRISVILPIKIGQRLLTGDELARLNKNKQAKSLLCPIDNGKKKLGEWDCTRCDARGGMGCFHGSVTEKVLKAATLGVKQEEEIQVLLEEVKDAASQLDEASRAELLGNLESLVSKIRTGDDTLAESESTEQFDGIADRERGIYEGDAEQTEQLELFDAEGDVYADLETRPGTTEDQRSTGRDALSDLSGLLNRYAGSRWGSRGDDGSAVAILGARIFKDFKAGKPSQLIGDEISSPGDLAVLAQVYRDPRFETFRIFYTKGDKVIGEEATSSRLPGSVKFNNEDVADTIRARMTALGADGYWMAHNHPTGRGQPSKGDRFVTKQIAEEAPGFKGHVVIDFNEYGSIQANGDAELVLAPELEGTDFMAKPTKDHPWLGMPVGSTGQAAMAAKALATEDRVVLLSINNAGDVQMISSADLDYLTDMVRDGIGDNKMRKARALAALRRVSAASGSGSHMIAILPKGVDIQEHTYLQGFAADVVSAEGKSLVETNGRVGLYVSNILGDVVGDGFLSDEQTGYEAERFDGGFYTKIEKLIADAKIPGLVPSKRNPAGAARARDWFAYLRARNVSNEEWESSGLRDVLREGSKDRYTRDELLALAAERRYKYTPETVILGSDGTNNTEPGQLWMDQDQLTGEAAAKVIAEIDMDGYWAGDGPDIEDVNGWAEANPEDAEKYIIDQLGSEGKDYIEEWKEDAEGMGLPEFVADRSYQPEIFSSGEFLGEYFSDYYIERKTNYYKELGVIAIEQFTTAGDYGIKGSPNYGFNLYRYDEDGSQTLVEAGISSLNEAQVVARSENSTTQPDELAAQWESYIEDGDYSNYREYLINLPNNPELFSNTQHFNYPNNLAFLRVTDRMVNGKNAFFIEELQSDWHQEGRQEGYRDSELMSRSITLEEEARTRSTVLMNDSDRAKADLIKTMAQDYGLEVNDMISVSMNMEDATSRLFTSANANAGGTAFVSRKVIDAAKADEDFNDVLYFIVDGKRNQEEIWNQYKPALEKFLNAAVDYENSRLDVARYADRAVKESRKTPDAPFKDDRWINLAAKKAVMEASKRDDVNAISWPTGESMEARWSDEYAELYNNTYDKKMPAIFGRLTGNKPYKSDWDMAISNYQDTRRMAHYGDIPPESSIERNYKYIVAVVRRNGTRSSAPGEPRITPKAPDIIPFSPEDVLDAYRASDSTRKNFEQLSKANQHYIMEEGLNNLLNITYSDYFYGTGEEIVKRFPDSFQLNERWMVDLPQETKDKINQEGQPLFRAGRGSTGTTVEDVQEAIKGTLGGISESVNVVATQADLPAYVRDEMKRQNIDRVAGYYDRDRQQVFLVADGIKNRRDAQVTLLHEGIGHLGIERVMGKEMGAFLFQVRNARSTDQTVAEAYRYVEENYPGAPPAVMASEVVARIAESDPESSFVQRIMAWLRGALRRLGMNVQFSNADIVEALRRARIAVERGEGRAPDAKGILFSTGSQPGKKQNLKRWFGKSVVVDDQGNPKVVYRGEHGDTDAQFQSRLGTLSFGDAVTASEYALEPNVPGERAARPRVTPAYIRMENPFMDEQSTNIQAGKADPMWDLDFIRSKLGDKAVDYAIENVPEAFYGNGWWQDDPNEYGFDVGETEIFAYRYGEDKDSLSKAMKDYGDQIRKNGYLNAFYLADDPGFVQMVKDAGYDGIIHGGNGFNGGEVEYRPFKESQVKSAVGNRGTYSSESSNILFSKSREEWRDANRVSQRMANTPEQQGLAKALQAGVINNEEYNRATREQSPIIPFDSVPKPATVEQMMGALDENKTAKVQPDGMGIPEGTMIGSRLDIPAYNEFNVWVVTAHDGKTAGGKAMAYLPTAVLKNVKFSSSPKGALNVATGKTAKAPFARMRGEWSQHMPDNARRRAQLAMKSDKWVQVGMNPYRHSYFYDKANARPVVEADEVIQVGALVMAKNPTYADPMDERFQVPGSSFLYEPGAIYQGSENLESWLGDSQIRNPDGTAKVLYHRTSKSFDTFKAYADGPSGAAIFLGDDPDNLPNAHNRRDEGDNIMPVFVRMENPLYLDEFNYEEMKDRYAAKGNGDFPAIISEATKYNLMSKGFDGIIAEDIFGIGTEKVGKDGKEKLWRGSNEYVVFDNSQIKSATGNPGIFGPSSNILFRASDSDGFTVPDETLTGAFIRRIQDKFRPLKDLQVAISEQGGVVNENNDVYLAEEAFHGKAENDLRLMRTQYVEPMIEKLTGYGLTRKELDQYLYAKHAPERNAHIAKINDAMPDGGSGMTNREAAEILARFRQQGKLEKLDEVAQYVYKMTRAQRQHILKGGLEDDGTIAAWEASYKYYVPLKGWAEDTKDQGIPRTGTGFNIRGQESRRAMGRASEAASPTAYAITDLTEKIVRSRKNQVGNALLKLVQDNPNPDYWRVYTDDDPVIERRIVKERDPETGEMVEKVRDRKARMASLGNDYFITKVDGKPYYIELQDERLMGAMKNVGPETNGAIIRTMASINRVLSALNTSYAPEFMVSNFARDVQTAILNLQAEQSLGEKGKADGAAISAQTVRDIPVSMRAIYNSLWNRKARGEKAQQWQKWFDEFRADGAKTGYFDMKPIEEQVNDIERMVTMFSGGTKGNLMKLAKNGADVVEHMNSAVENAVRLSAYVNARRAGISRKQAASLAKNMTVNFNRRGEIGTLLNSMYMFANASIQGTANFARTMLTFKGDGSPRWKNMSNAQKIGAGLVMGAYMMAMFNRYSAGDDDDGVNFYDKVPDWVKERNLILMKSAFGGEPGEYWKIPLPYGYNVFAVLGTSMEGTFAGNKSALEGAANMAIAMAGSFSPLGFTRSEAMPVLGTVGKMVTPTVLAPLPDLYLNENFFGSSIYTKNFPFGTPKPDSSLGRRSTPGQYKALSSWLNEVSGGSQWRSGKVDINPDILAYIAESYTGSAGDFFGNRIPDQVMRAIEGVESEQFQMPFIRRVSGKVMFYEDQDIFYRRRDAIGQAVNEMKALQGEDRAAFMREFGTTVQMQGKAKATAKRLSGIRKRRNLVYGDESLSARERDQQIKALNQEAKSAIDAFNRDWNERVLGK